MCQNCHLAPALCYRLVPVCHKLQGDWMGWGSILNTPPLVILEVMKSSLYWLEMQLQGQTTENELQLHFNPYLKTF